MEASPDQHQPFPYGKHRPSFGDGTIPWRTTSDPKAGGCQRGHSAPLGCLPTANPGLGLVLFSACIREQKSLLSFPWTPMKDPQQGQGPCLCADNHQHRLKEARSPLCCETAWKSHGNLIPLGSGCHAKGQFWFVGVLTVEGLEVSSPWLM